MNISEKEEAAMKELLNDDSKVIRPSDKSLGVVIINREDYEQNIQKELEDNGTYENIDTDNTSKIENKIKE